MYMCVCVISIYDYMCVCIYIYIVYTPAEGADLVKRELVRQESVRLIGCG